MSRLGRRAKIASWRRSVPLLGASLAAMTAGAVAHAQLGASRGQSIPVSRDEPVFYQADAAEYDRDREIIALSGHVEIWQGPRVLRADKVTYNRNTGVAAAQGNVALLEPDGQVLFADYAELAQGMKDGVLKNMRAQLAENGKLAANGARRTDARLNELSRVVYSTCNVCAQHPERSPLWDLRAASALQDLDNKRIEYRDVVLDVYGQPVAWLPYLTHPDPSQKRASGFLVPSFGHAKRLGPYLEVPYYLVIDDNSDATISPLVAGASAPAVNLQYRRRFNDGVVTIDGSLGYYANAAQGHIFGKGQFAINDEWRWGFDVNRASSTNYLRDYRVAGFQDVLSSQIYLEGFGQGAYSRVDTRFYQGLTNSIISARLPYVLPRYQYSFFGPPDALGGRLSLDAGAFNVVRDDGTNTQRGSLSLDWQRPARGALGDLWNLVLHVDSAAYAARQLDAQPTWGKKNVVETAQAMPTAAVTVRWPFTRDAGSLGTQVIEPIVQVITAPNGSGYGLSRRPDGVTLVNTLVPNEDSLDFEFTDATLFSLNRFSGIDRLEGGMRANVALHGAWYFAGGQQFDAQIGQGYRNRPDRAFPIGSGLENTVTDVVSHVSFTPNSYFDVTARQRWDRRNFSVRFADALATAGPSWLKLSAGYIYSFYNPYYFYDQPPAAPLSGSPRNEITLGARTNVGPWRFGAYGRRDLQTNQMVGLGLDGAYEDECFVFGANFYRRYTSVNNDRGASVFLFQITFKTVGTFGFHAL